MSLLRSLSEFALVDADSKGEKRVVASRDIPAGTTWLAEEPSAHCLIPAAWGHRSVGINRLVCSHKLARLLPTDHLQVLQLLWSAA